MKSEDRNMATITLRQLVAAGACVEQRELFANTFGKSVEVTIERAREVAELFDWDWARCLLSPKAQAAYDAAKAPAQAACNAATASAWAAYNAATAPAWAAYDAAMATAQAAYNAAIAPALVAHNAAIAPARAAYSAARATAWAEAYLAQSQA